MKWKLRFSEKSDDDLSDLDSQVRERVIEKIEWLAENFEDITPLPLTGEYSGFYKLRVGDWRVFYKIYWNKKILLISYVRHRNFAYN